MQQLGFLCWWCQLSLLSPSFLVIKNSIEAIKIHSNFPVTTLGFFSRSHAASLSSSNVAHNQLYWRNNLITTLFCQNSSLVVPVKGIQSIMPSLKKKCFTRRIIWLYAFNLYKKMFPFHTRHWIFFCWELNRKLVNHFVFFLIYLINLIQIFYLFYILFHLN